MKTTIVSTLLGLMFLGSKAQNACEDYYWLSSDWPDGATQNFAEHLRSQGEGDRYLNGSDFAEDGDFYGKTWEEVFWSGVNATKSPPDAYYRPLGFRYAKLGAYNDPTICLSAFGVQGYKVELMVYTLTPQASLCVEDMNADNYNVQDAGALSACDSQYIYKCFDADTDVDSLEVSIYCKTNCEDGANVHVLWRFRRSSLTWEDSREFTSENPEMWCNMIASNIEWPDEIEEAIPEEYEPNNNISSGNMISGNLISISSFILCIMALLY